MHKDKFQILINPNIIEDTIIFRDKGYLHWVHATPYTVEYLSSLLDDDTYTWFGDIIVLEK